MNDLKFDSRRQRVKCCPCGRSNKNGKFVPYIGYSDKGYCHSCGETFLPEKSVSNVRLKGNSISQYRQRSHPRFQASTSKGRKQETEVITPVSFIRFDSFKASLKHEHHHENNFIKYLLSIFDTDIVNKLIEKYFIGTSSHWPGSTAFWQIDISGKIRTGKIMLYSPITGKRSKEPYHKPNWIHSVLKLPEFGLQQCFFGEHLLKSQPIKPVAIVESEKTAIIASVYLPKFLWLACGGLTGLTVHKCSVLKGRQVFLFPDLNGFEKWSNKANELSSIASFKVFDLLEQKATETERAQGLDLVDYLTRFDHMDFQQTDEPELWDYEDFAALNEMMEVIRERGIITPGTVQESILKVNLLKGNQNQEFRGNLNTIIQFIALN